MCTETPPDPHLAQRLESVQGRIADAAKAAGRDARDLTLIVVTKFQPVSLIRQLLSLGVHDFGENRHQEARDKAGEFVDAAVAWHFLGQLQTNKARQAARYASVVHSVDRVSLVDALAAARGHERAGAGAEADPLASDEPASPLDVFIQVNLTADPQRGGVPPTDLDALVEHTLEADGIRMRGLMAVAPLGEDPRRGFERLRLLSERVRARAPTASEISAGMSGDFEAAIAEGATHLRIGTAITGERPGRD